MSLFPSPAGLRVLDRLRKGDRLRKDAYGWGFSVSVLDWVDGRIVRGLEQSGHIEIIPGASGYPEAVLKPGGAA